jgi:hypothetical protein
MVIFLQCREFDGGLMVSRRLSRKTGVKRFTLMNPPMLSRQDHIGFQEIKT